MVLYEVYVRSFYDSDGNGIGDLQGVTKARLHRATPCQRHLVDAD